jgi:glycerol-3-phosphate cytidylyltransferase
VSTSAKLGYTQGVFDLLHFGPIKFLQSAGAQCSKLTVGIISDDLASTYKARPVLDQNERKLLVQHLRFVNEVIIIENKDPVKLARTMDFKVFFWGEEWKCTENFKIEKKLLNLGINVTWLPRFGDISSSKLRKTLQKH